VSSSDGLKLTAYFGEGDRVAGRLVSDALHDVYEANPIRSSVLLRGIEGFGVTHLLRTQRLLTLSEDLPLVSVAIDEEGPIGAVLPAVAELVGEGLLTVERVRVFSGWRDLAAIDPNTEVKLTIDLGRGLRPGFRTVVDGLRRHGVSAATVLIGLDGMVDGVRQRARFFSTNRSIPLTIVSVGAAACLSVALRELEPLVESLTLTRERVTTCRRDGRQLADPPRLPDSDEAGLPLWQKLTVHAPEQSHIDGHPLYVELVRRLRAAGAAGATAIRGIWGYSGDHAPHGDTVRSIRRRVPVVTTVIDRPQSIRAWWEIVKEVTRESGLVTSEIVPAFQIRDRGLEAHELRLAQRIDVP
jgi:PII-like signaling protein